MNVDWGGVWRCSPLYTTDNFLTVVTVVDIRGDHLFVGVIVARDVKGVEAE